MISCALGSSAQVVWAVRDDYVGNTFFDASASAFVLPSLSLCGKPERAPAASHTSHSTIPSSNSAYHVPQTRTPVQYGGRDVAMAPASRTVSHPQSNPVPSYPAELSQLGPDSGTIGKANSSSRDAAFVDEIPGDSVDERKATAVCGAGLGPDWVDALNFPRRRTMSGAKRVNAMDGLFPLAWRDEAINSKHRNDVLGTCAYRKRLR